MRKIKISHIKINNFCGLKELDSDLSMKTLIKGKNAVGKSTVRNAVTWVLFDKLADGSSATGIRPHDNSGVDIDFVDIIAEITFNVDGRDIVISKRQYQNWVKNKSTQSQEFKGNVNEYMVNGIPKKDKDFKLYLEENLAPADTLMFCMNPFSFLTLNNAKRREKLFELANKFDIKTVIKKDKEYKQLENDLKDGTLEELIARSKKAISSLKKKLEELPARIDEVSRSVKDMDFAELELLKAELQRQLDSASKKKISIQEKIMDLNFKLNDYKRSAYEKTHNKKVELSDKIADLDSRYSIIIRKQKEVSGNLKCKENELATLNSRLKSMKDSLKEVKKRVFDNSSLICPTCNREYDESKKLEIKAQFEEIKQTEIDGLNKYILDLQNDIDVAKDIIKEFKGDIATYDKMLKSFVTEKEKCEKALSGITEVDLTGDKKYEKIVSDIKNLENEVNNYDLTDLNNQLIEVNQKLAYKEANDTAEDRIAELKQEQRNTAQLIADQEKMLDLLERFNRDKISVITDNINSYFDVIKWVFFEKQINGAYKEVCNAYVNGTSYDGTLNHGDKLLAEIDICRAFAKSNNLEVPIILDDSESIDGDRVPNLPCQIITLRRTDDKKLTIEEV